MQTSKFISTLFFILVTSVWCLAQDVHLSSQAEVDAFDSNITAINGGLIIGGTGSADLSDIQDLSNLSNLTTVWSLTIKYNDLLANLNGLSNLTSLTSPISIDGLTIIGNNNLINVDGLSNLNMIEFDADISINSNSSLTNIDGITNIGTTLSKLEITNNSLLENLPSSFLSITSISYLLDISGNYSLLNLDNLLNISSIDYLKIEDNSSLVNIDGLSNLNVVIHSLIIAGNDALENMDGFTNLTQIGTESSPGSIGSSLHITNNSSLTNIDGLSNLTSIGSSLLIINNNSLTDIDSLSSLNIVGTISDEIIGGAIRIEDNGNLTQIDGLAGITAIGNINSATFPVFGGYLSIVNNASLENVDGLSNITSIEHHLEIINNNNLVSIDGLSGLQSIGNNNPDYTYLEISSNDNLENIDGLSNLATIDGSLRIESNSSLQNLNGLSSLSEIERNLDIQYHSSLDNIDNLSNLTYIGSDLNIRYNSILMNCCGIQNLLIIPDAIGGGITIENNLTSCDSPTEILDSDCGNNLNIIEGNVFLDIDGNCLFDLEDILYENIIVQAISPQYTYTTATNSLGDYKIHLDTGSYEVKTYMSNPYTETCTSSFFADILNDFSSDTINFDFPTLINAECPYLEVDVNSWALRECFDNYYHVQYCNSGTIDATDAYIELELDAVLSISNASIPFTGPDANNIYTFEVGTVGIGDCSTFNLNVQLPCDSLDAGQFQGQTFCINAHIYPDSICLPPSNIWDGSSVQVTGECDQDSVRFRVRNIGIGDMLPGKSLQVFEDQVMFMDDPFQLQSGEEIEFTYFANGSTFRLDAEQSDGHPGNSNPSVVIEGCGSEPIFSLGFVNQFSQDDGDVFVSSECREVTGSYDPNDKQAFPTGYGEEHFIEKNTDIEYLIRFQNTGTDTAFTVVVTDEISPLFDITTINPGASSHPYTFEIDSVVRFTFDNILLVDSITNEAASHGFVKFRISQQSDLPNGTLLENTAKIYFDFNAPIITNTAFHTVGENFITIDLISGIGDIYQISSIKAYPNPFSEVIHFELEGDEFKEVVLSVYDVNGRQVANQNYDSPTFQFNRGELNSGVYFYTISVEGMDIANGKMILR